VNRPGLAIRNAKYRGSIVIIIAHRPSALAFCDKVLLIAAGSQQAYGPRDEIMRKITAVQTASTGTNIQSMRDVSMEAQR
jgi:ATP-binding cassette subfamily C protein